MYYDDNTNKNIQNDTHFVTNVEKIDLETYINSVEYLESDPNANV